ncbi:MAG: DUF6356 family protein [Pseudomonadota bacterium]
MSDTKLHETKPRNPVVAAFTDHPTSVDETYLEHMGFALRCGGLLALAAGAAIIHAVLPFACERTASRIVRKLYERTAHRGTPAA